MNLKNIKPCFKAELMLTLQLRNDKQYSVGTTWINYKNFKKFRKSWNNNMTHFMKALLEVVSYGIENKFGSHYTWYTNIHVYELLSVYTHFHIELQVLMWEVWYGSQPVLCLFNSYRGCEIWKFWESSFFFVAIVLGLGF